MRSRAQADQGCRSNVRQAGVAARARNRPIQAAFAAGELALNHCHWSPPVIFPAGGIG
jgi:hypothetical protein